MKKGVLTRTMAIVTTAVLLAMGNAAAVAGTEMSDTNPTGDTAVKAVVANGDVTYTIAIPEVIDFGRLAPPATDTEDIKEKADFITLTSLTGTLPSQSGIAVLAKDSESSRDFRLIGQDATNSGKTLDYSIKSIGGDLATQGTFYPNGYAVAVFKSADDIDKPISLTFCIDQKQLFGQDLNQWAGSYNGTINFYSGIKSIEDIKVPGNAPTK